MRSRLLIWLNVLIILLPILKAEDSLKSALNAVNRRQRDLSEYKRLDYGFSRSDDTNDNIAFLKPIRDNDGNNGDLERALLDYLEKRGLLDLQDNLEERPSLFRERVEKDRDRHRKNMEEVLLNKLYADDELLNDDEDIPRNYYKYPENINSNKRSYNSALGWNSVGMRKRSRYFQPDGPSESLYLLNYAPRDEIFKRLEEEENDSDSAFDWNSYPKKRRSYRYTNNPLSYKRLPISKRSGNTAIYKAGTTHHHKRSSNKDVLKTDPKVEKDLTNIFNPKDDRIPKDQTVATVNAVKPTQSPNKVNSKEDMSSSKLHIEKAIEIKKKSINWSDYFGLDRRKKYGRENNNDWFIKQYQNVAAQAQKRSEYPLNFFHEQSEKTAGVEKKNSSKESRIKEMDDKLKDIEESIVDDTLKFTGAHEDMVDSKEIQEVKDKIISRLAAAYSLEKMRRALRDYEESLNKESGKNEFQESNAFLSGDKRIAVPRKQAIDEHRENVDERNDIKCTDKDDSCDEQNYKPSSELLDEIWPKGDCPKIEQACNEVLAVLDNYGHMFESACNMFQACLLCGDNNAWYYPNRQCNSLFLLKADGICDGNNECLRAAHQSLKYLLQINQSLRSEDHGACELECPDK